MPARVGVCGLPLVLLVILSIAVRCPDGRRGERHPYHTVPTPSHRISAGVCDPRKVAAIGARDHATGNAQTRTAAVAQGDCLSRAGCGDRLASKGKAGVREADRRCAARLGKAHRKGSGENT